jgi:hypothetical protein
MVETPDFKKLAIQVKAEHDRQIADRDREHKAKDETKAKAAQTAFTYLRTEVLALLEQARADFGEMGIEAKVVEETSRHGDKPQIKFQLLSPRRRSDSYQLEMPPVFFRCEGEPPRTIVVGMGEQAFDSAPSRELGRAPPGTTVSLVETAIREALEIYHREWEPRRHSW